MAAGSVNVSLEASIDAGQLGGTVLAGTTSDPAHQYRLNTKPLDRLLEARQS